MELIGIFGSRRCLPGGGTGLALLLAFALGCAGAPKRPDTGAQGAGDAEAEGPPSFRGSQAASNLAVAGWIVVEERLVDLDGDGRQEALVVEGRLVEGPEPESLRVSFWDRSEGDWTLRNRSEERPANRVGLLEFGGIECGETVALVELIEESPDEIRRELQVFEGQEPALKQTLVSRGPHRDPSLLDASFLSLPLGFARDPEGTLVLRDEPVIVELTGTKGERRTVLLGASERPVGCESGALALGEPTFRDGRTGMTAPADAAGDGSLETGVHPALGARITIPEAAGGRLLRLVPGCAGSEAEWKAEGQVSRLRLSGPFSPFEVDLEARVPVTDSGVLASGLVPLGGASWARQFLLVFQEPLPEGALAVDIVEARGPGCVAEVELHRDP